MLYEYICGSELERYEFSIELYNNTGPSSQFNKEKNAFTISSSHEQKKAVRDFKV